MPTARAVRIGEVDAMDADAFVAAMGPLFEGAPRFLAGLAAARPFGSVAALFDAARTIALAMPEHEQIELLDKHPRIGAASGSISALSRAEQGYETIGVAPASPAVVAELGRPGLARSSVDSPALEQSDRNGSESASLARTLAALNEAYEARFGFRFVVFVAGRPREAIVPELRRRLGGRRADELQTGLAAVVDIARDRWRTLGGEEEEA